MKANFLVSCAVAAILSGSAVAANAAETVQTAAADQPNVGDIIVTAQRRDESIQKVPLTIQAFSGDTLSKLNVVTFNDLLKYTPNVTYSNNGPGQGAIFMRGLSSGFASATLNGIMNSNCRQ